LLARLKDDDDPLVRAEAGTALGKRRLATAAQLVDRLIEDDDPHVRIALLTALGNLKANAPTEPLLACLKDDTHPTVQVAAATALLRLGYVTELLSAIAEADAATSTSLTEAFAGVAGDTIHTIVTLLQSGTKEQRLAAAWALGSAGQEA